MATFTNGTPVPADGNFHIDPLNPIVSVKYLSPWHPPGVTEVLSGGTTACLGALPDGTVLKYIRDRDDRHAVHSLNVEKAILSALGPHPRIVQYLSDNDHGIVLRRAENGDLRRYLLTTQRKGEHHPTIPLELRRKWIRQTAQALSYVHSRGVIHSDMHPNNLLLDANLDIRLCDFAGSVFGELDGGAMESTRFCLPRDWRERPGVRSDLFALGSVVFFMLTGGREPYEELGDGEVEERFGRGEFPDVGGLEGGYGDVVVGCWRGEFESAGDVLGFVETVEWRGSGE
ncbi:kinase-like protein [Aaosphaeria arxii CBS 175.79]|uniref:Kinase-like protein n=1 Tax=Aaosphaeria arxii CBS 175.79 TaxID=1450172 RepID=A0A6A5XL36_9PLEO|nr:kinase-like protein [Aaosphaeria arxii CBS 175.79]KAF2013559.1 kinase-like protein [Aaosphaeria arxii CBS 175.79]